MKNVWAIDGYLFSGEFLRRILHVELDTRYDASCGSRCLTASAKVEPQHPSSRQAVATGGSGGGGLLCGGSGGGASVSPGDVIETHAVASWYYDACNEDSEMKVWKRGRNFIVLLGKAMEEAHSAALH